LKNTNSPLGLVPGFLAMGVILFSSVIPGRAEGAKPESRRLPPLQSLRLDSGSAPAGRPGTTHRHCVRERKTPAFYAGVSCRTRT
jgi:hypothetical protein